MRNVLNKIQIVTRWFLIAGVLSGLFFSSGEGVQLLPFPSPISAAFEKNKVSFQDENSKSYSLSVHNSAANSVVVKSKPQKNLKDLAGAKGFGDDLRQPKFISATVRQNNSQPAFFKTSNLITAPSDRAPPAI